MMENQRRAGFAHVLPLRRDFEKITAAAPSRRGGRKQENLNQSGSELSRQIAVDLKADADFDECRCGPGHGLLHLVPRNGDPSAQPLMQM
jgi:hypothetical protein